MARPTYTPQLATLVSVPPDGDEWLHVVTIVDDPVYLSQPLYTSTNFRKEADGSKFAPVPEPTLKTGVTALTAAALELLGAKGAP